MLRNVHSSSMNGFDAVIFAYGQTASGKTFTLVNSSCLTLFIVPAYELYRVVHRLILVSFLKPSLTFFPISER